ncbi:MAG: nucleotide exchange factor GrpE [Cytophagales bacterium]|nr:nucleotide exchange factor GrpE [Bernardetiaceae bacterium]MDW8203959.1 nucleotide exchange factor GrpE [Cytophagales bacterium]
MEEHINEHSQQIQNENNEFASVTSPAEEHHEGIPEHIPEPEPIEQLRNELNEAKDKYLRLYADFENYRKRVAKEKIDFLTTANEELILKLLPILDDFERAQKSLATDEQAVETARQGFELIYSKFLKVLENKGLKAMNAKGAIFNPDLHEAITQFPAPSEDMKGKVIDEVEKGYLLGEKVIRCAKVVVGT